MKRLLLSLFSVAVAYPQVAGDANKGYTTKEGRARVASTLGATDRDARQKPNELVAAMEITPGMTVADVGTGIGYMLPFLSKAAGPKGKVLAEDIQTDFLDKAKEKAEKEKLTNVEFVLGSESDPKLPPNAVDVILILDTYHHFDYPEKMLASLRNSLKSGGRLVIVDFYKNAGPGPGHIRADLNDVRKEITGAGFEFVSQRDHIPNSQFMLTFRK
jgi:ubiquinone/menaquinone biosynthesis C-methylase UbiE